MVQRMKRESSEAPAPRLRRARSALACGLPGVLCLALAVLVGRPSAALDETGNEGYSPVELALRIDAAFAKKLAEAELEPAPLIDDAGFLRRAALDLRGSPPSGRETYAFLQDKSPDKRAKAIKRFLAESGYAEHWGDLWSRTLLGRTTMQRRQAIRGFEQWMEDQLAKNRPYDAMVRDIVTAEGAVDENGAAGYAFRYDANPLELAANTSRHFMGVQIQCAQCHDHPYADYKQKDFQAMAGYFGRIRRRIERRREQRMAPRFHIIERKRGVLKLNKSGDPVRRPSDWGRSITPGFIVPMEGVEVSLDEGFRVAYAKLLTHPKNRYFAKLAVNRVWSWMFGRGLCNPVDDLEQGVSPHSALLAELGEAFEASGYDLKWLIEGIALSKTWQRDSRRSRRQEDPAKVAKKARDSKDEDKRAAAADRALLERMLFARAELRPLTPEQLFRSVMQGTGLEDLGELRRRPGFRTIMRGVLRQFTFTFDNGVEGQVEEFSGTIPQALLMMNGDFVNKAVEARVGNIHKIVETYKTPMERIQWIYMSVLSRPPSRDEIRMAQRYLKAAGDNTQAYEDLAWVLFNSSEFLFNS